MRVKTAKTDRKIYTLSEFRGVDYSSSPLEVKPYRAADMANLLLTDGKLHKRKGWKRLMELSRTGTAKDIYSFGEKFLVRFATIETSMYCLVDPVKETISNSIETKGTANHAVVHEYKGALYVLDGTYRKFSYEDNAGEMLLSSVSLDKDYGKRDVNGDIPINAPYIPTTTVNIVSLEGAAATIEAYPRTQNDSLNLLSVWRKNRLIFEESNIKRHYKLDGVPYTPVEGNEEYYPTLTMQKGADVQTYKFSFENGVWNCDGLRLGKYSALKENGLIDDLTVKDVYEIYTGENLDIGFLIVPDGFLPWTKDDTWNYEDVMMTLTYANDEDFEGGTLKKERLFSNNIPTISMIYGVKGANDRLFIAGTSENAKNIVFYTENEDLTYIPAMQQLICGYTNSSISAMLRLSDGALAVFKDISSSNDVSVYYITGQMVSLGAGTEGNTYYSDFFSVSGGTINETGISAHSTINYDGDALFISKGGVYALVLSDNLYTEERYARERSRPMAAKFKVHDLKNASAVVYNSQYWLALGDGSNEVYVADSRYKHTTESTQTNSYNYEWFRLTDIPAVSMIEKNGELYFLSSDGWLCKFHDEYVDIYKYFDDSGEFTVTTLEDGQKAVVYDTALKELIAKSSYALVNGEKWSLSNLRRINNAGEWMDVFDCPQGMEEGRIALELYVPIITYWLSAVLDLGSTFYKKNLWSIYASADLMTKGKIHIGYKTRNDQGSVELRGTNAFNFGNVDFTMFTFDGGGFMNAFRQRIFERGIIYLQLMYSSESIGDSVVHELGVEYAITQKNMGIG